MNIWPQVTSIAENLMGTMGIAWKDLSSREEFFHNPDEVFPAASIIKINILIELLRQADKKDLSLNEELLVTNSQKVGGAGVLHAFDSEIRLSLRDLAALMIIVSDNTATNLIINRIGIGKINSLAFDLGLSGTVLGRTFMTHPNLPPANFTTPKDTLMLLQSLYNNKIISPYMKNLAIEILSKQQFKEKIPRFLPKDMQYAHKTGEITGVRHDAGIILDPNHPFILVALTKDLVEEEAGNMAISEVSKLIYNYVTSKEHVK